MYKSVHGVKPVCEAGRILERKAQSGGFEFIKENVQFIWRQWTAAKISLYLVTTTVDQKLKLLLSRYTFSDDLHMQGVSQVDRGFDDGGRVFVYSDVGDKRTVDFQIIDGKG